MNLEGDSLYGLLPVILRERDQDNGYPLRALLRVIATQAGALRADMWQLYKDHFIETCQPWVIPYLGELVGNELIWDAQRASPTDTAGQLFSDLVGGANLQASVAARSRADVANTIRYRRRKGTSSVLEALARDVTGWFARAVEMRNLLGVTQQLDHQRRQTGWADLRAPELRELLHGPFDQTSHTASIRQVREGTAYAPDRMAMYLWRLQSYPLVDVSAGSAPNLWQRSFSPLRNRTPLFRQEHRAAADRRPVTELDSPGPIRPAQLEQHLAQLYGTSLSVTLDGQSILATDVRVAALHPWPSRRPEGRLVHIDPTVGRLAIGEEFGAIEAVDTTWHAGFSGDLGGGPYDRHAWLIRSAPQQYTVSKNPASGTYVGVEEALAAWAASGRPNAVVAVLDSGTFRLPRRLRLRRDGWLAIEAVDTERPVLVTDPGGLRIEVQAAARGDETEAALTLNGVVVEGHLVVAGAMRHLRLLHCTLVPGRRFDQDGENLREGPSLVVRTPNPAENRRLRVEVAFSITGSLRIPEEAERVWVLDSILDGQGGQALTGIEQRDRDAAPATIERSTILGSAFARELMATEVIFDGQVEVDRTQQGCLRYCYIPRGSTTPQRFACQPDVGIDEATQAARGADPNVSAEELRERARLRAAELAPRFTSVRYGEPGYCQLALDCPSEIRTGAEDGSEMGAFSFLKQPQRESNLELRLAEYLPIGLESAVIHVT